MTGAVCAIGGATTRVILSGDRYGAGETVQITAGPVTASIALSGGFTYAWTKVSGDDISITSPASDSTTFTGQPGLGNIITATFRCTVTKTASGQSWSGDVEITLERLPL